MSKWKTVPEEPTEEMLTAGNPAIIHVKEWDKDKKDFSDQWGKSVYQAMLAAAPSPPALAKDGMSELMEKIRTNLGYLENLIELRGHESVLLREHPHPCNTHDFCFMRQAQKGADAIREIIAAYEGKEEG